MREQYIKQQIKVIYFTIFFCLFLNNLSQGFENKIKYKINNEIITSLDIEFEKRYLVALNPGLNKFDPKEIVKISERSIINEKIKEQEIEKYFKEKKIPKLYLEKLLKDIYFKLDLKNLNEFKIYLENKNVIYQNVVKKITIEALWNEIILSKFSSKIKIDENAIKDEINKNRDKKQKSYLMSEIFFELNENEKLDQKFNEIKTTIQKNSFENAALKFSISETYSTGGKLDWINENSLNKNIIDKLVNLKINEHTQPIVIPGGFLILKINKIKTEKKEIDIEKELKKMIRSLKNYQFNQFSNIHFNKIKNNIAINEI